MCHSVHMSFRLPLSAARCCPLSDMLLPKNLNLMGIY